MSVLDEGRWISDYKTIVLVTSLSYSRNGFDVVYSRNGFAVVYSRSGFAVSEPTSFFIQAIGVVTLHTSIAL